MSDLFSFDPKQTLLVGIGYKSRQGKTTLAEALQDLAPHEIAVFNTSDLLINAARWQGLMGQEKDSALLQMFAGVVIKNNPDFLIQQFTYAIRDVNPRIAVLAGIRDAVQFDWIKMNGGVMVKISRMQENGKPFQTTDRIQDHWSETNLSSAIFDYSINIPECPDYKDIIMEDAVALYEKLRMRF